MTEIKVLHNIHNTAHANKICMHAFDNITRRQAYPLTHIYIQLNKLRLSLTNLLNAKG